MNRVEKKIKSMLDIIFKLFPLFFNTYQTCCDKQRIKKAIYIFNGDRISEETSVLLYIGSFTLNLIITYIVIRLQLVSLLLYMSLGSHISMTIITWVSNSSTIYFIISIYEDVKNIQSTLHCSCLEAIEGPQ